MRNKSAIPTDGITITVNERLAKQIDSVLATGFFGATRAQCCERLMCEAIRQLIREKTIVEARKTEI